MIRKITAWKRAGKRREVLICVGHPESMIQNFEMWECTGKISRDQPAIETPPGRKQGRLTCLSSLEALRFLLAKERCKAVR
jgi:hypothetical protein